MKAMLWKEFRENFKWAVLALLVLTLAEFYALSSARQNFQGDSSTISLCDSTFLLVTSFGCAVAGAFLGVVQVLPERNRDRWAMLLHRPVSRDVIFFGKVCAGLLLYIFATVIPFFASVGYAALPGNFAAPFLPGLMVPGLSDLALGPAFYFAAWLLCLQRGRWFGVRGALLAAVAAVFVLHLAFGGPFLLLPVLAAAALALAAWGAMLDERRVSARPWPARAVFVALVLGGVQGVLLVAVLGAYSLLEKAEPWQHVLSQFLVTRDGQVLRVTANWDGSNMKLTEQDGKPVTDERYVGNSTGGNFAQFRPLGFGLQSRDTADGRITAGRRSSSGEIGYVRLNSSAKEYWYLLRKDNYFAGYDVLSRRCIGICDREGFKPPGAKPVPFAGRLHRNIFSSTQPSFYWDDARLYSISFFDRRLNPFTDVPGSDIYQALKVPNDVASEKAGYVVLALGGGFKIVDEQGGLVGTFPYPHDRHVWTAISVGTNQAVDRIFIQSSTDVYGLHLGPSREPDFLDELDLHGKVLHAYSQPIPESAALEPGWRAVVSTYSLPFAPVALSELWFHRFWPSSSNWVGSAFEDSPFLATVGWGGFSALALSLAGLTFFQARRVGFSGGSVWRWTLFVFAFGPAGLLTFRLAPDWPARVRCPACGGKRSLGREDCPCCQEAWPSPPLTGREIFEPQAAVP